MIDRKELNKMTERDIAFARELIARNTVMANTAVNTASLAGNLVQSTREFKDNIVDNEVNKANNEVKDSLDNIRNYNIEKSVESVKNGEVNAKWFKDNKLYQSQDTQMGILHAEGLTDKGIIKLINSLEANGRPGHRKTMIDKDHLYTGEMLENNETILRMFLNATPNGTLEEAKELVNDNMNLVSVIGWLNESRTKSIAKADTLEGWELEGVNGEWIKEHQEELLSAYKEAYLNKDAQLKDLANTIKDALKPSKVYNMVELVEKSFLNTIVLAVCNKLTNALTEVVNDGLVDYVVYNNATFSLRGFFRTINIAKVKSDIADMYESFRDSLHLPTIDAMYNGMKDSIKNIYCNAMTKMKNYKETIKSMAENVKSKLANFKFKMPTLPKKVTKHDLCKNLISGGLIAITGIFSYSMRSCAVFSIAVRTAITVLVNAICKIVFTVVYTIFDIIDVFGETTFKYNEFVY